MYLDLYELLEAQAIKVLTAHSNKIPFEKSFEIEILIFSVPQLQVRKACMNITRNDTHANQKRILLEYIEIIDDQYFIAKILTEIFPQSFQ